MHEPRGHWLPVAVVVLAGLAFLPAAAGLSSASGSSPTPALAAASGYANLNSPSGQIVLGSPLPQVEIQLGANPSMVATLSLDYLLELAPNVADPEHPQVVAVAAPETLAQFNGSITANHSAVRLLATLPVYPAYTPLWANGTSVPQTSAVAKQAILDVNYSVVPRSDGSPGVLVKWTVAGWPWVVSSGDELALEYVVQVVSGSGFETCTGTPADIVPASACASNSLGVQQAVWESGVTALKGTGPAGSAAWVTWDPTVGGSAAPSTAVSAGVYPEAMGTSDLVIAAAADGAEIVSGSTLFILSPAVTGLVGTLVADLPAYGGAAALCAAAAATGIVLSRRRDRAIERELAQ